MRSQLISSPPFFSCPDRRRQQGTQYVQLLPLCTYQLFADPFPFSSGHRDLGVLVSLRIRLDFLRRCSHSPSFADPFTLFPLHYSLFRSLGQVLGVALTGALQQLVLTQSLAQRLPDADPEVSSFLFPLLPPPSIQLIVSSSISVYSKRSSPGSSTNPPSRSLNFPRRSTPEPCSRTLPASTRSSSSRW